MKVQTAIEGEVTIPVDDQRLSGELIVPAGAQGIAVFAHGSGSSRHSPRNKFVAGVIREHGVATLLFDLLTRDEEAVDIQTRHLRFDIGLLAKRLVSAAQWLKRVPETSGLKIGFFGSSTGGGAALVAAAELGADVGAVVSRGGRPDLAGNALTDVRCPVLLIVGGLDDVVIRLNELALSELTCEKELRIVPGATHLFEEPGKLEIVAELAADWFERHLSGPALA